MPHTQQMITFFRLFLFQFCFYPLYIFANNPCTAIAVPNNGVLFNTYNLTGQTASGVQSPPCGTYNDPDMWFSFIAPAGGSVTIEIKGITANDPAMAIYSGNCGAVALEGCYDDQHCGDNPNPGVSLNDLAVGATYYIRVWNEVAGGGQFKMRILNLNQSNFSNQFNAFNTAPNCVQLTAASNTQRGCSWYNAPLDFEEAFELEFDLYFGDNDAGADGICLVFSTNQNCGGTGGGIGASGIPNSIIIEFDTWDNGMVGYDDIPEDHTSIHINGDFTSSIAGPVGLGNIEDGQSHPARIIWDPITQTLSIFLDGAQVLQLVGYDAVNNVFMGQNEIFWGWTASTGGANNQQSFCFETAIDNTSAINETVDLLLCDGESYTSPNGNTYVTEGEFMEEFTASNGCNSIRTINIEIIPVQIKLIDKIICSDESYVLNGTSYTAAGQYTVTLPGIPCDTIANLNLSIIDFDIIISKSNDLDCINNSTTLQATLTDNSSNPFMGNFEYYWTTSGGNIVSGQGTDQIIVDQPGQYQVLIYALDNIITCSYTSAPISVDDNSQPPTSIIVQQGPLDCTNTQAILDGSASNPGPLLFTWTTLNGNYIGNNFDNILLIDQEGDYSLIVENFLTGCKDTSTIKVIKTAFNASAVLQKSSDLNCQETTIDLSPIVTNGGGLSSMWSTMNGNILSDPSKDSIKVNQPGLYTFTLSDGAGCTKDYSITVSKNVTKPIIDSGLNDTINCINSIINLQGSVITPITDYISLWYSPGNIISNPEQLSIAVSDPGFYILKVEDTLSHCVTIDTVTVLKDINLPDLVITTPDMITCSLDSIKLLASLMNYQPSTIYLWETVNGTFSGQANDSFIVAKSVGSYSLTVTNPINGCKTNHVFDVNGSPDQPISDAGPDKTLDCAALSAIVTGSYISTDDIAFINFSWSTYDGSINGNTNNLSVEVLSPGHYIFEVTNLINGCKASDTLEVFQSNDKPILNVSDMFIITCDSITQTIIPNWQNAGNNPIISWSTLNGSIVKIIQDSALVVDAGGIYQLQVVNPQNNCLSVIQVNVDEDILKPSGTILVPDDITCGKLNVSVIFDNNDNSYQYSWSTMNGTILSPTNQISVQAGSAGTYDLLVKDTNNGCSSTYSQKVEVSSDYPIVDAGSEGILNCKISQLVLHGSVDNVSNYGVNWTGISGGNIISGASSLDPVIDQSGIYVLTVINLANQCTASDTVNVSKNITEPEFVSPHITDANCFGENGSIYFESIQNGSGPYIFKINGVSISDNNLLFDQLKAGDYNIEGEDQNGCMFNYAGTIASDGAISFNLPESVAIEFGHPYQIIPEFLFDTIGMTYDAWIGADYLDCNPCLYPTIMPTYNSNLTLSVKDKSGCPATEDIEIRVFKKDINLFVPNVFSPGDHNGINDNVTVFTEINTIPLIDEFKIYNRWGAEVFSKVDFLPNDEATGWNGYFNGKLSNPGVYVYYVKCHDIYGESLTFKGGITIIQ